MPYQRLCQGHALAIDKQRHRLTLGEAWQWRVSKVPTKHCEKAVSSGLSDDGTTSGLARAVAYLDLGSGRSRCSTNRQITVEQCEGWCTRHCWTTGGWINLYLRM